MPSKTYVTKAKDIQRDWWIVDAKGQNLGRLAAKIAPILRGKHKPIFTPNLDTGDFVIVINCEQIEVTGNKLDEKFYYRYSGYPGGLSAVSLRNQLAKFPDRVITAAVRGMNCAMPSARSPLRVTGPTAPASNRLSCQITRAKNSTGSRWARAAASISRQIDSRLPAVAAAPGADAAAAGGPASIGPSARTVSARAASGASASHNPSQSRMRAHMSASLRAHLGGSMMAAGAGGRRSCGGLTGWTRRRSGGRAAL